MLNKKMADYIRNFEGITVSSGTLNTIDLICMFTDFIDEWTDGAHEEEVKEAYNLLHIDYDNKISLIQADYYNMIDESYINFDDTNYFLNEVLFDLMQDISPNGFYFGSQEGDGALFGYWMIEGEL